MNLNNSASPLPPSNNPILDSYLNFRKATPFVTRTVLMSQLTCFFLSFLFDLTDAIANTPYFTVQHYEVYRIILSPFLCSRFISLVLAYFSFTENGRRLELSIGSTGFLVLIFTIGVLTNLIYILLAYTINAIIDSETSLFLPASGIWIILFGIISIECSQAPPQSMRKLFLFPVRATYYPLALFSVFTLLGIFEITSLISIGLGYAYGKGYLEKLIPSSPRCKSWEESILENLTNRDGWIACNSVLGSGAWNEETSGPSDGGSSGDNNGSSGFLSQLQKKYQQASTNLSTPSSSSSSNDNNHGGEPVLSFPTSGGQKLGNASRRPTSTADPRQARLQAIQRRLEAESKGGIV